MPWTIRRMGMSQDGPDTWDLAFGSLYIGRDSKADIHLDNPTVSRNHAVLSVTMESLTVRDLGSSNGIYVNEEKVGEKNCTVGDVIRIGSIELRCEQQEQSSLAVEPSPIDETIIFHSDFLTRARVETSNRDGVRPENVDAERLRLLFSILQSLANRLNLDEMLPEVLSVLENLFSSDRCAIASVDRKGVIRLLAGKPDGKATAVSSSIVKRVVNKNQALLCDDIQRDLREQAGESVSRLNIRSVLCAPLVFRSSIHGLVYLERSVANSWNKADLELLVSLSQVIATVLENASLYTRLAKRFEAQAEELSQVERRLLDAERTATLGRLAQIIAHEVRNPLMIIGGLLKRLDSGGLASKDVKNLEMVLAEVRRLETMMQQVEDIILLPSPKILATPLERTVECAFTAIDKVIRPMEVVLQYISNLDERVIFHDPQLTALAVEKVIVDRLLGQNNIPDSIWVELSEIDLGIAIDIMENKEDRVRLLPFSDPHYSSQPWTIDLRLILVQQAMASQDGAVFLLAQPSESFYVRLLLREPGFVQ